jgi:hypothetical protein
LTRILAGAAVLWLTSAAIGAEIPPPSDAWIEAPDYLLLFAPSGPRAAAYHIYVSRLSIDTVLARLAAEPSLLHPPGAWVSAALLASDAFGETGSYDRSTLARLYGSRRAFVAHGPRGPSTPLGASPSTPLGARQPTEAWTLISPYPRRDMAVLEPGTMLVVVNLALP